MALELDAATQAALAAEIKRRIPDGEQKQVAYAIAGVLGTRPATEESRLSRFLHGAPATLLGIDRAEEVLEAISRALDCTRSELIRAALGRSAPARDRHPAWQDLGAAAPWVDVVPGLPRGMDTLRQMVDSMPRPASVQLSGPAGMGKSARLWRADQQKIGTLVDDPPGETEPGRVWLVDEPADPEAWIAWANQHKACIVIATRAAEMRCHARLTLDGWGRHEVEEFLELLDDAAKLRDRVDLDLVADVLAMTARTWTPFDAGNMVRLLTDEPALLGQNHRELRIRAALHQLRARAEILPHRQKHWETHGRAALATAAVAALRGAGSGRAIAPIAAPALHAALETIARVTVGGATGEPLHALLARARDAGGKSPLKVLETWARTPSSEDLLDLLVDVGAWRRDGDMLHPIDESLALALAPEALDEDARWRRLRATLGDPSWAKLRMEWAWTLDATPDRLDELLACGAAIHVGAIELATALVAFGGHELPPSQVTRVVFSAVQILDCLPLAVAKLGGPCELLIDAVRAASRRYRAVLPVVTTELTPAVIRARATETVRQIVAAVEELDAAKPAWLRMTALPQHAPWVRYATMLPWQALPVLQERESRHQLVHFQVDWDPVIVDHAEDGDPWARAVAAGDVEDLRITADLLSVRHLLSCVRRWPPQDLDRHQAVLGWIVQASGASQDRASQYHAKLVHAIADLVRRHPSFALPHAVYLQSDENLWRDALDEAGAIEHLQRWFEAELAMLATPDVAQAGGDPVLEAVGPNLLPPEIKRRIDRLLRVGEVLHRHGARSPLRSLLSSAGPRRDLSTLAWSVATGAGRALVRLRDADALRDQLARSDSLRCPIHSVLCGSHDMDTELWIADVLGTNHAAVFMGSSIRPGLREAAKRWAINPAHVDRRRAAAVWLLEHAARGESDRVVWLFTQDVISLAYLRVSAGLTHPDPDVQRAAASLLRRAIRETDSGADLSIIARCFTGGPFGDDISWALMSLKGYIKSVNHSDQQFDSDTLSTTIRLTQRHLSTLADEVQTSYALAMCRELAIAARRGRLASLAAWIRDPLGPHESVVEPQRAEEARYAIVDGILDDASPDDLELGVLQAAAETANLRVAVRAHGLLLERAPPGDADLIAEWRSAPDSVIVEVESGSTRWYAVQGRLQQRDPRTFARLLADRLLALPPELRRRGILQIPQVALHDAEQAARLSALFD